MSGHEDVRDRIALSVAGGLSPAQERELARHTASCAECAEELDSMRELAFELKRLPTPMPAAAVVERVRRLVHLDLAGRADERLSTLVLVFLLFFSWTVTSLSLLAVRLLSGASFELMSLLSGASFGWSAAYLATAWLGGGVAVVLLGLSYRKSRRFV